MMWLIFSAAVARRIPVRLVLVLVLVPVLGLAAACATRQVPAGSPAAPAGEPAADTVGQPATPAPATVPAPVAPAAIEPDPPVSATQPPAPAPLRPLVLTQIESEQRLPELDTARLSILMAEPIAITDLLLLLVRDTAVSIVPDPGIEGSFVGELKDVTLRQALELALAAHELEYVVRDGVVRVFPRRTMTRLFDVDHVTTRRAASATLHAGAVGAGPDAAPSIRSLRRSDDHDLFDELGAGLEALLSPAGRVHVDRKAALVQVTDFPDRLRQVEAYLDRVRVRVTRQVHLQARVIEVTLDDDAVGLDWPAALAAAGGRPLPDGRAGIIGADALDDVSRLLAALAAQGQVRVLASPGVVTLSNEPVVISTHTSAAADGEAFALTVTPHVGAEGIVTVSVSPSVTGGRGAGAGDRRAGEVDTVARLRDGETLALTGLSIDRPPRRRDLLILLTTTVLATGG